MKTAFTPAHLLAVALVAATGGFLAGHRTSVRYMPLYYQTGIPDAPQHHVARMDVRAGTLEEYSVRSQSWVLLTP